MKTEKIPCTKCNKSGKLENLQVCDWCNGWGYYYRETEKAININFEQQLEERTPKQRPVKYRVYNQQDHMMGDFINDGIFVGYGTETDNCQNNVTKAIIESCGGTVEMVYPSNFIFVQESRTPKMSAKEWLEERSLKYEALTEEVKPIMRGEEPWRFWECPNCGHRVYQAFFYCPFENCGVKLNWKE